MLGDLRISLKLLVLALVGIIAANSALALALTWLLTQEGLRQKRQTNAVIYYALQGYVEEKLRQGRFLDGPQDIAYYRRLSEEAGILLFEVVDREGQVIFSIQGARIGREARDKKRVKGVIEGGETVSVLGRQDEDGHAHDAAVLNPFGRWRYVQELWSPWYSDGGKAVAVIHSMIDLSPLRAQLARIVRTIGLVTLLAMAAATLVAWRLGQWAIGRPISRLKEVVLRIREGDIHLRAEASGKDEVGQLAAAINSMTDSLLDLRSQAEHDPLTGLYNRRYLMKRLREEIGRSRRYGRPFSLMIIDLDGFKRINDRFGHQVGDEALQAVAAVLKTTCRSTDIVGRYGGDEFMVILPEIADPQAEELGRRICERLPAENMQTQDGERIALKLSVGLASYPGDATLQQHLIDLADAAMYAAKREGLGVVMADPGR